MKVDRVLKLLLCVILLRGAFACAAEDNQQADFLPTNADHASWVFSGVVTNEMGENYGYFFQIERDDKNFHSIAALFEEQHHKVIVLDEGHATIADPTSYNWHVGRAFLRFNPINESWIFGLQTQDNKGFNFKVDMLSQTKRIPVLQDHQQGIALQVNQTYHLNGHLQAGGNNKEEFVTANNAWFRQLSSDHQEKTSGFTGVLCRFNDGSGFYSLKLNAHDSLQSKVAGWCDGQGLTTGTSPFVKIQQEKEGRWHIRGVSSRLHLVLDEPMQQNSVIAGFVKEGKAPGFCMVSQAPGLKTSS
jgi:hypothetical protein